MIVSKELPTEVIGLYPQVQQQQRWMGEKFSHLSESVNSQSHKEFAVFRSIIPTNAIFHDEGGAEKAFVTADQKKIDLLLFNERTEEALIFKKICSEREGVLYRLIYNKGEAGQMDSFIQNDYAAKYFQQTFQALQRRKLDLLIDLVYKYHYTPEVDSTWARYKFIYKSRKISGSLLS